MRGRASGLWAALAFSSLTQLACETHEPVLQRGVPVVTRYQQLDETEPSPRQPEMDKQINLYTAGRSGVYVGLCSLIYDRQLQAIGLVARRWLELNQDAAAAAVTTGLINRGFQIEQDGGEVSQATVLHALLPCLGEKGWKGFNILDDRRSSVKKPTLSADDETWLRYLRNDAPSGTPKQGALWLLVRDPAALAYFQDGVDDAIQYSQELSKQGNGGAEYYMGAILFIAPPDDGVTDTKLKEWSRVSGLDRYGARWGANLALARRADKSAQEWVRRTIKDRFALLPEEAKAAEEYGATDTAFDPGEFQFVIELASTPLEDRWELLLDLLRDAQPELLAARAAVILGLEEHWTKFSLESQDLVRETVADVYYEEENEWLQSLMISFLASHPNEW